MSVRRSVSSLIAAVALLGSLTLATHAAAQDPGRCRVVTVPVGAPGQRIVGDLCEPPGEPGVLQLLVHGGTYDASYWDFKGFGPSYSYSAAMNAGGYATLAVDLLGVGRSSHPPSAGLTIQTQAKALHTVVDAARRGDFGSAYDQVVLVGHSLGTLTAYLEASTYHDVDGVVATGTSHSPGVLGLANIFDTVTPARLDPVTAPEVPLLDLGYLSTPNARQHFYSGGAVDPAVMAADEQHRRPVASGYALTLLPYIIATGLLRTDRIDVPVLLANGIGDSVFCAQGNGLSGTDCSTSEALLESEGRYFAPAARLETFVLSDAGHNINLVPHAEAWHRVALDWFARHFPLHP